MAFVKANKEKSKLRLAIAGPSGAGKTFTALTIAGVFGKVAVVDSEHGSSSKYADRFNFDLDAIAQTSNTKRYEQAIIDAENAGYDILIIESLSNAWDSVKADVDRRKAQDKYGNGFNAWGPAGEAWKSLLNRIESSSIHIIVTMRSKVEYTQEKVDGKTIIRKLGMAPEVRDGTEYIFDAVIEMEVDHAARVGKTRCDSLDGYYCVKPTTELGTILIDWLSDGVEKQPKVVVDERKVREDRIIALINACHSKNIMDATISEILCSVSWYGCADDRYIALSDYMKSI